MKRDAISAASRIGYPVVVKPYNGNHGRGVSINLTDADQVIAAFHVAQAISRSVIVEKFIVGHDHRMLVVNGQLIAVSKRMPGHVVGDGQHTIAELVDEVNRDPRRGVGHEKVLTRIDFDYQAERLLEEHGLSRDSVPAAGQIVYLRTTANLSTGGTAEDVTDIVHPDNVEMAVRAISAIGLDVGGVDFLSPDISESYKDIGGAICEVNAAPGFRMHMAPSSGRPRDVAGPVLDMLFAPGSPSRIPIAALTGTNGKTTTARMLAHIMKLAGHRRRADDHGRRLRRRPAHRRGRHDGTGGDAHGAERPVRGRGRAGDGARRACCAPAWACVTATWGPCSTSSRITSA